MAYNDVTLMLPCLFKELTINKFVSINFHKYTLSDIKSHLHITKGML